ncbi:glycerol-3-phosphate dehydrogenase [Burkholderiaceae bacterium DAT-1]|nr:glycerol-3-phosphate dehydrogenase [Burkholderiaceae bacterium DAT-1]
MREVDVLVVGGGINGVGIANHLAALKLDVLLVEQADLASATSSASSKLIHGGLRYLEYGEFRLVREALNEREVLLGMAPHLIWPLTFVLPHMAHLRPAWMIRAGLFLYDHLGGRKRLPASRSIQFQRHAYGEPLMSSIHKGFTYADCWADDARLVVANAIQLRERGGEVRTRTKLIRAQRMSDGWVCTLKTTSETEQVKARALVNAGGPWVSQIVSEQLQLPSRDSIRMVKGSHIVVPRLHDGPQAYILQQSDQRIVFVLPYEHEFSLIGTTDEAYEGDPAQASCSDEEVSYLCNALAPYFKHPPDPRDVVWRYSGVRPLHDDDAGNPSAVSRDYVLRLDTSGAPVLSVFGGKLTTYRQLSMQAAEMLGEAMQIPVHAIRQAPENLPGGDINCEFESFLQQCAQRWPWLDAPVLQRMAHQYGSRLEQVLSGAHDVADLGEHWGAGLYSREVAYLVVHEWASHPDDVLWRRTKCGLHMGELARRRFTDAFTSHFMPLAV